MSTSTFDKTIVQQALFESLKGVTGFLSVTLVGSFCDKGDISVISDIDTIVVVEELTEACFNECINAIKRLTGSDLGFPAKDIHINPTFGPLKLDTEKQIVVHLMVYDVPGHREHVLKSPFTCYDWERSNVYAGKRLEDIYPVQLLSPRDFTSARRGLANYLSDLQKGVISYRWYRFESATVEEVLGHHTLDGRHQGEYAYHIVRNLVANYCKLVRKENVYFTDESLVENWKKYLPECVYFIPTFLQLYEIKRNRGLQFPDDTIDLVEQFVHRFEESFEREWRSCLNVDFVRHGRTELNDGSFLGQGRDPKLAKPLQQFDFSVDKVYSSPLLRSMESAKYLSGHSEVTIDGRLAEMDYGAAEGMILSQLTSHYPEMIKGWTEKRDPRFPGGENTSDVLGRLNRFLDDLKSESGKILVVSHNVVLRCLIGSLYDIPTHLWYKIEVPHGKRIGLIVRDGNFYLNVDPELKGHIIDSLL